MNLTKKDVVVLALAQLGATSQAADTEDVAIAAHALASAAFGWRKHVEHVDLDTVRTSLRHEAEAGVPRVAGSIRNGWSLTAAGREWVAASAASTAREEVVVAETSPATARYRAETRVVGAVVDRIRTSEAYAMWKGGASLAPRAAAAVFRIDEYTPVRDRHLKTARIRELVAGDSDLTAFIDAAAPAAITLTAPTPGTEAR